MPVAVNCSPAPTAILAAAGDTVTETRTAGADGIVGMVVGIVGMVVGIGKAGMTVRAAVPGNGVAGSEAVMVATPVPAPVARP